MSTVVLVVILLLLLFVGVRVSMKRFSHGCCGTGDEGVKKVRIGDRNRKNYPWEKKIQVEGMTCRNCALRVENALNSLDGIYAKVDLGKKEVHVLMKEKIEDVVLREKIREAGYWTASIREVQPA